MNSKKIESPASSFIGIRILPSGLVSARENRPEARPSSASQGSRRRMRLEEDKVIAGYHADLASEALGFGVIAFIYITLATHSPDNAKRFRALVDRVDDIQEAYSLTGDADYLLKAVLRDLKSLADIVNNVLMPHQSVAHVRSSIVLDRLKESSKLPLKELAR
jgi:DNA-binding Lrp family transcriptional regulator